MRSRFDAELEQLNVELIEMGALVEQAIATASEALVNKDPVLAQEVIDNDGEINKKERAIENLCLKLLLQQHPVARDLRMISTALKIITDMERIGDQAADISDITIRLADEPYIKKLVDLPRMARATITMVNECIDAFVGKNPQLARDVIAYDDVVDDLFNTVKLDLINLIREDAAHGHQALELLMVAKYFERIGDHAVNIASWVLFFLTGIHSKPINGMED